MFHLSTKNALLRKLHTLCRCCCLLALVSPSYTAKVGTNKRKAKLDTIVSKFKKRRRDAVQKTHRQEAGKEANIINLVVWEIYEKREKNQAKGKLLGRLLGTLHAADQDMMQLIEHHPLFRKIYEDAPGVHGELTYKALDALQRKLVGKEHFYTEEELNDAVKIAAAHWKELLAYTRKEVAKKGWWRRFWSNKALRVQENCLKKIVEVHGTDLKDITTLNTETKAKIANAYSTIYNLLSVAEARGHSAYGQLDKAILKQAIADGKASVSLDTIDFQKEAVRRLSCVLPFSGTITQEKLTESPLKLVQEAWKQGDTDRVMKLSIRHMGLAHYTKSICFPERDRQMVASMKPLLEATRESGAAPDLYLVGVAHLIRESKEGELNMVELLKQDYVVTRVMDTVKQDPEEKKLLFKTV